MSKLTDLEMRKLISMIELNEQFPKAKSIEFDESQNCFWVDSIGFTSWPLLDPLTDDALCFKLMIKYDIAPFKCEFGGYECVYDVDLVLSGSGVVNDENPNRAICIAIIHLREK
jgi:hypothetical protein